MRKINVYKIEFNRSSFDLNEDYDLMSDSEQEKIASLDAESFFDYENESNHYICYIICNSLELKKYSAILINNLINHSVLDLSKDILSFKINLEEELKPLLSTVNSIKYSFFIDDLNDWIMKNLEIDNILDRILEVGGVKNLTDIEKEFLKNFQLP